MTAKDEFIKIYTDNITRKGSAELLEWIGKTDFFTAPASTKFHCACEHGLVMHSVSVFNTLMEKYEPKDFVHGHIHRNYDFRLPQVCQKGNTTVINAYEYCIINV